MSYQPYPQRDPAAGQPPYGAPQPVSYPDQQEPWSPGAAYDPYRCSEAHILLAWLATFVTLGYTLPWAISATRGRRSTLDVVLVDLLLGWTGIGWIVALVMSFGTAAVPFVHHYPPAPYGPPGYRPGPQYGPAGYLPDPYAGWSQALRPAQHQPVRPGPAPALTQGPFRPPAELGAPPAPSASGPVLDPPDGPQTEAPPGPSGPHGSPWARPYPDAR